MTQLSLQRILLIEDDLDIQLVAQLALQAVGGFTVALCSSGKEALTTAPAFDPDLILLDVMMPDMDGPDTLQQLRMLAATATTPVIFLTAKAQPYEIAQYRALGALDVIAKPFDPMTFSSTVERIWTYAHG